MRSHRKAGVTAKTRTREKTRVRTATRTARRGDVGGQLSVSIRYEQARSLAVQGGFTGYKPLPPGIRKNLARGKPLPPGIAKKAAPPALLRQLPQRPGYEWQVCGTDLVLVAVGTLIVAEVLKSVFD
ncbi:UNVERIFIED_ORG: anti-virulence regulator CigR family protein [Shinella sp. XGS7]|nr:anti-virulence regulator CigR family protein [Shinella sp. XGS7]